MTGNATSGTKACLLRVGVDTTRAKIKYRDKFPNGGFLGSFRDEGTEFEFIPVPENKMHTMPNGEYYYKHYLEACRKELVYRKLPGIRLNKQMIDTMAETDKERASALRNVAVHWDPDFINMTYGDRLGKGIQELNKNDILVFCASLQNQQDEDDCGLFIIGYFTLKEKPLPFKDLDLDKKRSIIQKYKEKNIHFSKAWARAWDYGARSELLRAYETGKDGWEVFILALGDEPNEKSGLLSKAMRITDPKPRWIQNPGKRGKRSHYYMSLDWAKTLGLRKEQRLWEIGPKSIEGRGHVENLIEKLEEGKPFHTVCPPSI